VSVLRHAIVLTAGLGTRLRPLTLVRAKPAIPVAGQPMVRRIVRRLADDGVTDLVLNLHHLPHTLSAVVGDGSDLGVSVRYSWEQPAVLGSAGGPRQALPILGAPLFWIINGDTLTDANLTAIAAAHLASDALVTLALVPNLEPHRYGGVLLDDEGRVIGFARRLAAPSPAAIETRHAGSYHFIGVQVACADAFRDLAPGQPANSIGGVYDQLIASRAGAVRGFVSEARFWDVGTTMDYWKTNLAFREEGIAGRRVTIDPSARVTRSILWDDVDIGPESTLDECIVTDGVSVPARATYRRAILLRGERGPIASPLLGLGG